jgi:hypothetical protein
VRPTVAAAGEGGRSRRRRDLPELELLRAGDGDDGRRP